MVGGGVSRKEDGFTINSSNVFAALDTLRKKKKSDKTKSSSKVKAKDPEPAPVFWPPPKLNAKSWADVDDDDEDDYFATTAPPVAVWGGNESQPGKEIAAAVEESESEEEDVLDLGEEEVEDEHEVQAAVQSEPVVKKAPESPVPAKETERQLSKKERRKKELEELEAVLAEFGGVQNDVNGQETVKFDVPEEEGDAHEKDAGQASENGDKKEGCAPESKNAKKKKKKDKSAKEAKDSQEKPNGADVTTEQNESAEAELAEEASIVDMKERLKKISLSKKKKSSKEMDAAAKAAALEAAARSAKLAAAKKKEKNHYNQQPVR
ncbi:hypothetical protein Droror1_Dr00002698 [Drosera rotundifolia]